MWTEIGLTILVVLVGIGLVSLFVWKMFTETQCTSPNSPSSPSSPSSDGRVVWPSAIEAILAASKPPTEVYLNSYSHKGETPSASLIDETYLGLYTSIDRAQLPSVSEDNLHMVLAWTNASGRYLIFGYKAGTYKNKPMYTPQFYVATTMTSATGQPQLKFKLEATDDFIQSSNILQYKGTWTRGGITDVELVFGAEDTRFLGYDFQREPLSPLGTTR